MGSREEWEQWYGRPDPTDIDSRQGDLLDVIRRPEITDAHFDLAVTAEVLYYLQTDAERREVIAGIAGIRKRGASNSQSTH